MLIAWLTQRPRLVEQTPDCLKQGEDNKRACAPAMPVSDASVADKLSQRPRSLRVLGAYTLMRCHRHTDDYYTLAVFLEVWLINKAPCLAATCSKRRREYRGNLNNISIIIFILLFKICAHLPLFYKCKDGWVYWCN